MSAAEGNRTPVIQARGNIPVIHPFQIHTMRMAAKANDPVRFRRSFGQPTDPFPTLLTENCSPFSFWYKGEPEAGCIRRPTETECERLLGLPDGWTKYGDDGKQISSTQRYRALGNSIALPCAEYIMAGIKEVLSL